MGEEFRDLPATPMGKVKELMAQAASRCFGEDSGPLIRTSGVLAYENGYPCLVMGEDKMSLRGDVDRGFEGEAVECLGYPAFTPYKDRFYCNFKVLLMRGKKGDDGQDRLSRLAEAVRERDAENFETKSLPEILVRLKKRGCKPNVRIVCGANSEVYGDVWQSLKRHESLADIERIDAFMRSAESVAGKISEASESEADVLLVIRGGGPDEEFRVFDDPVLIDALLGFDGYLITAIGHSGTLTLADFVADAHFSTPDAAGRFLSHALDAVSEDMIAKKEELLNEQARNLAGKEEELRRRERALVEKNDEGMAALRSAGMKAAETVARERNVLAREKALAAKEAEIAERERAAGRRETGHSMTYAQVKKLRTNFERMRIAAILFGAGVLGMAWIMIVN